MQLFGLLNLNKPAGITSRRLVDMIQRLDRSVKVGHAGTLDPLASGVVVVGVGHATRLMEYVQEMPKRYDATFLLGRSSTTEDIEGQITEQPDAVPPTHEALERAARALCGDIEQRPPIFSALKVAGRRAYEMARAGETPELRPRMVRVDELVITQYEYPELRVSVKCGGGTYVRSLGRDLAELVGSTAVMSALVRTAVGEFKLEESLDPTVLSRYNLSEHLLDPRLAIRGVMDEISLAAEEQRRVAHGLSIPLPGVEADRVAVLDTAERMIAILERRPDGSFKAAKNFSHAE